MSQPTPTREGDIPLKLSGVEQPCFTHYKIFGEVSDNVPTAIFLHGGPGAGHAYLLPFAELWTQYKIPCVFYDQVGCGQSTHLPETVGNESLWKEDLFLFELDNVIDHLHLRDGAGYHLIGQSFGGMMSAAYAARKPSGLQRLVLASALASKELSVKSMQIRRSEMPPELQLKVQEAEAKGDFDDPAYKQAQAILNKTNLCRVDPLPSEVISAIKTLAEDKTVYSTMNGPSPLTLGVGSMRDWTVIPRLPLISVPTLVYNGEYDTSHDIGQVPFFEHIPRVRWWTVPNGGHMCHVEGPLREKVLVMVAQFLTQSSE